MYGNVLFSKINVQKINVKYKCVHTVSQITHITYPDIRVVRSIDTRPTPKKYTNTFSSLIFK